MSTTPPISHRSIRFRFAASLGANILRAGLSFITGLVVARGIGPSEFGEFTFLLGSFTAIRQLLDMGSSNAFFTFLSRNRRTKGFVFVYLAWQGLQFILPVIAIGFLLPQQWIDLIWIGRDRSLVVAALAASFMQQQAWQSFMQIGDSLRQTHRVQLVGLATTGVHFVLVVFAWQQGLLGLYLLFAFIACEYLAASMLVWYMLRSEFDRSTQPLDMRALGRQYWAYCAPLAIYSWVGFAYTFSDNWMLQRFGGSVQQAFYAIGAQFSTLSMFATASLLQIFWKEVAEAQARGDREVIERLYRKVSRLLYAVAAVISGYLIPWSKELISIALGPAYSDGAMILSLMLLYPLHQTMGQVNSTLFFATGKTGAQVKIGIASMALSIPVTYFVLAPHDALLPGMGLGGLGMALKLIVMTIVVVNLTSWWFSRMQQWHFDWAYQVEVLGGTMLAGYLSYIVATGVGEFFNLPVLAQAAGALAIYLATALTACWRVPQLFGLTRPDITHQIAKLSGALAKKVL